MKFFLSLLLLSLGVLTTLQAQDEARIGGRINYYWSTVSEAKPIQVNDISGYQSLNIDIAEIKEGGGFGLIAQVPFSKIFYIQPELLWDFHNVIYKVDQTNLDNSITSTEMKEVYYRVDAPVSIGVKLFGLKAFVGGIARFQIDGKSDFENKYDDYKRDFDLPTWAWHVGAGIDLGPFIIDLKYEQNLNDFGNHFSFGNEQYSFQSKEKRLILAVGFVL